MEGKATNANTGQSIKCLQSKKKPVTAMDEGHRYYLVFLIVYPLPLFLLFFQKGLLNKEQLLLQTRFARSSSLHALLIITTI